MCNLFNSASFANFTVFEVARIEHWVFAERALVARRSNVNLYQNYDKYQKAVLRILDVSPGFSFSIPDPGSKRHRIPDPDPGPGSTTQNLSIFNPKTYY
jgi:hypothetical protein